MDTFTSKINKSRRALARHNANLVGKTRQAGSSVAAEAARYATFVGRETASWRAYVAARGADAASAAARQVSLAGLEHGLLVQLARVIDGAGSLVSARLEQLEAAGDPDLPLADYERKTARAIVAELASIDDNGCRQIYEFEGSNKRRATVLRAIEQRLAA